jgi:hypothetical protein
MRLSALLLFLITCTHAFPQIITNFPYQENFEGGAGNWSATNANSVWVLGTPAKTQINGAYSGINAWCTGLTDNYPNNRLHSLESPLFNFGSLNNPPYLRFKYNIQTESCCDVLRLEYSLDDQNWITIGSFNTGQNWYNDSTVSHWSGSSEGWKIASHRLDNLPQTQNFRLRFRFFSDYNQSGEGVAIDDIEILSSYTDIEIRDIISPQKSACSFSSNADVSVSLQNLGQSSVNNISLNYTILNSTDTITESLSTLDTGIVSTYTFNQKANLSQDSIYQLKVWLDAPGDNETVNDAVSAEIVNLGEINQFPYVEDFETGSTEWASGGVNSSWALGRPRKQTIRAANSDTTAWVTGNTGFGFYNDYESSFVLSPCFNTSGLSNAQVRFAVWWESESDYDGANIEYTLNDGQSWNLLNNANGINWYNNNSVAALGSPGWSGNDIFGEGSDGYVNAILSEPQLAGKASLRFRINFASDVNTRDDGFAFDDFSLISTPSVDLSMDRANVSGFDLCQGNGGDSLWVYFSNSGNSALSNFNVNYEFGSQSGAVSYAGSLAIGAGDSLFLSTTPASDTGNFMIRVYSDLSNDGFALNDTLEIPLIIYAQKAAPLPANVQFCDSSRALLTASGDGLIKWYSDAALEDLIYVGDTFMTGIINSDSTFYLSNSEGDSDTIGAPIRDIGTGSYTNVTALIRLEVTSFTTIASAEYFSQSSGSFKISLQDENGQILQTQTIIASSSGRRRAFIGFDLAPGVYDLKVHDFSGLLLYRNTSGADYESYANNHIAIIGNNFDPEFYYYLYNLRVLASEPCPGSASIQVTRGNVSPVAGYSFDQEKNRFFFYNTSQSGREFTWIFENLSSGAIDSSNAVNPEIFLDSGSYTISLIAGNDCGADTISRNFEISEISAVEYFPVAPSFDLTLYPNPARNILNWRAEGFYGQVELHIVDIMGRELIHDTFNTESGKVDISSLEKGFYILRISGKSLLVKKSFIVE